MMMHCIVMYAIMHVWPILNIPDLRCTLSYIYIYCTGTLVPHQHLFLSLLCTSFMLCLQRSAGIIRNLRSRTLALNHSDGTRSSTRLVIFFACIHDLQNIVKESGADAWRAFQTNTYTHNYILLLYIYIYYYVCVCVYACMHVCIYYIYILHTHIYIHIYIYTYIIHIYIYYTYIHIYIYIYIHIHIYTYITKMHICL